MLQLLGDLPPLGTPIMSLFDASGTYTTASQKPVSQTVQRVVRGSSRFWIVYFIFEGRALESLSLLSVIVHLALFSASLKVFITESAV